MSRPIHTHSGFRRVMQMSGRALFAFVEGRETDPYFFDRLCSAVCHETVAYEITRANRLAEGGGKETLLGFFHYLRTAGSLRDDFKGKRTVAVFFLDKDVDDLLHKKVISEHIIYTCYYTVENYLFVEGDLVGAVSSAAALEEATVRAAVGNPLDWRRRRAQLWRDWVVLCFFAHKHGIPSQCTYRRAISTINMPVDAEPDQAVIATRRAELEAAAAWPPERFARAFAAAERLVDALFRNGRHDLIFKGKWYAPLMQADVARAAGDDFKPTAFVNSLLAALRQTLDFNAPWSEHLRTPLQNLLTGL